jgi:hypothetical protein
MKMSKELEDRHTRMSWREKEEAYAKHLAWQRHLERKSEHEAEKRKDDELTGDVR